MISSLFRSGLGEHPIHSSVSSFDYPVKSHDSFSVGGSQALHQLSSLLTTGIHADGEDVDAPLLYLFSVRLGQLRASFPVLSYQQWQQHAATQWGNVNYFQSFFAAIKQKFFMLRDELGDDCLSSFSQSSLPACLARPSKLSRDDFLEVIHQHKLYPLMNDYLLANVGLFKKFGTNVKVSTACVTPTVLTASSGWLLSLLSNLSIEMAVYVLLLPTSEQGRMVKQHPLSAFNNGNIFHTLPASVTGSNQSAFMVSKPITSSPQVNTSSTTVLKSAAPVPVPTSNTSNRYNPFKSLFTPTPMSVGSTPVTTAPPTPVLTAAPTPAVKYAAPMPDSHTGPTHRAPDAQYADRLLGSGHDLAEQERLLNYYNSLKKKKEPASMPVSTPNASSLADDIRTYQQSTQFHTPVKSTNITAASQAQSWAPVKKPAAAAATESTPTSTFGSIATSLLSKFTSSSSSPKKVSKVTVEDEKENYSQGGVEEFKQNDATVLANVIRLNDEDDNHYYGSETDGEEEDEENTDEVQIVNHHDADTVACASPVLTSVNLPPPGGHLNTIVTATATATAAANVNDTEKWLEKAQEKHIFIYSAGNNLHQCRCRTQANKRCSRKTTQPNFVCAQHFNMIMN